MTDLHTAPVAPTDTFDELVAHWTGQRFEIVAVDLYRDIHKGIRAELFSVTEAAGSADPGSRPDRAAVADHVSAVAAVLESHAHHEDAAVDPALEAHLPALAERINADHARLETRFGHVVDLAASTVDAADVDRRRLVQLLHLELSGFTSEYLAHLVLEERVVMPALAAAIGMDEVIAIHTAIVGSIPPEEMMRTLAFMLPAMNGDDRVELLGGMRLGAPPEAFAGVVDLARSVLGAAPYRTLCDRLDLDRP